MCALPREGAATPIKTRPAMPFDPLDHLDASLQDLDFTDRDLQEEDKYYHQQYQQRHQRSPAPFGYPSTHSGFLKSDTATDASSDMESSTVSGGGGGGYSPPAWRRLGNGDRSSGFWRKGDNLLGYGGLPPVMLGYGGRDFSSLDYDSAEDECDEDILAAAIRTRLPTGSMSPEKERSPDPDYYAARANSHGHLGGGGRGSARDDCDAQQDDEPRIKSEEPSMEEMKATLAALPPKDDPENCMSPLSWSYSFLAGMQMP